MKDQISRSVFTKRTGLTIPIIPSNINCIVPMKEVTHIEQLLAMPRTYLEGLLRSITLEGDTTIHPYKDAVIELGRIDPRLLLVGQTFIERSKYQRLIENLSDLFGEFCTTRGFAKCTAYIVIGRTAEGRQVIAHYLPPIIEVHSGKSCLIDGVHRNYNTMSIGTTIEAIVLREVDCPPPCDFDAWKNVKVVDQKPPREERFINLNTALFRNLGWSGIDG